MRASTVHFYVTENDSVDGTREILQDLRQTGYIQYLDSITLDGKSSVQLCEKEVLYNCDARVERLGMLRQRVLDAVLNSKET